MIGSRRKRGKIYQALIEEGVSEKKLKKVHSPIGLDIGAGTPEKIAVSIVAELIRVRATSNHIGQSDLRLVKNPKTFSLFPRRF